MIFCIYDPQNILYKLYKLNLYLTHISSVKRKMDAVTVT